MLYSIILWSIWLIFILFLIFILILKNKIGLLENQIDEIFQSKNNLIPALFEVTKRDLIKHDHIFHELIKLKKIDFSEQSFYSNIHQTICTQQKIHKELDFIFRASHKHKKLIKDYKFYYIKELLFHRVSKLWESIALYKKIIKKYNKLITIKNLTIVWLLIPIQKKEEI
jgi:hypothetical protein